MTFRDLELSNSYISKGEQNISEAFLNPVLKWTKEYKRSVGFFSSSVLETLLDGVMGLVGNNGHIYLIASPVLSEDDIQVIEQAYEDRADKLVNIVSEKLTLQLELLSETRL